MPSRLKMLRDGRDQPRESVVPVERTSIAASSFHEVVEGVWVDASFRLDYFILCAADVQRWPEFLVSLLHTF